MNKLLSLLSTIIISVTIIPMVIVESFYQSQNIRNKRQIESHSLSRVSLSTVITDPNLGELPNNNRETILARLSERNPNVDIEDIKLLYNHYDNTYFYVNIFAKPNSQYFGWEIVNFSISQKKSISTVITDPNLGELPSNNCKTILTRLSERNPNVDITQIIVTFVSDNEDGSQSWRISPSSNSIYYGGKNIRFKTIQPALSRISLSTVITNPNLGELPNNNRETVLARLSERNPNVDITQIIVTFVSDNEDGSQSWRIIPSSNSIYYGSNNIRSANNYEIWNN